MWKKCVIKILQMWRGRKGEGDWGVRLWRPEVADSLTGSLALTTPPSLSLTPPPVLHSDHSEFILLRV